MKTMLALVLAAVLAPIALHAEMVTEERIVPGDRLGEDVEVRDVHARDGAVSGSVVNRSRARLRDVRLMIRHQWLWNDEMHPGNDQYSRADYFTVPGEIPPGGQAEFTYRPSSPLEEGRGGHFETDVRVASVVEVTGGSPSPTAGAGTRATPMEAPIEPDR